MPIKNLSSIYRPQRSGKIHLGIKNVKRRADGTESSYPSEVDFFVLKDAPWLIPFYGEKPTLLHVSLPSARFERENFVAYLERVFPQYLKRYKKSGLMCKGDGEVANAVTPEGMAEIPCPCDFLDKGECKRMGSLRVRIQEVPSFNVVQIDTSSFNSIVNINSFVRDLVEHCVVNRVDVSDVKLILTRKATVTQRLEKGGESKTSTHHVLMLDLDPRFYKTLAEVSVKALPQAMAPAPVALPAPSDPDTEEFYPNEREPGDDELPQNDAKKDFDASLKEFIMAVGVLTRGEQKGNDELKTDADFKKATAYYKTKVEALKKK